jgi:hypothetical protein
MIRFPTMQELEQGYAQQMADDQARWANPRPPEPRDQDDRPALRVMPPYCPQCGKVFDYATKGMSVLQMRKHQARVHPEIVMVETD